MDHTMSDLAAELPPDAVERDPRYQQVTTSSAFLREIDGLVHEPRGLPLWHLDGVPWHEADEPRRGHKHWAQTIGATSPFHETWRCPCGAFYDPYRRGGWIYLDKPRVSGLPIVPAARPGKPGMTEDQELRFCLIVGYGLAVLVGAAGVIGGALSGYGTALGGGVVLVLMGLICLLITVGVG